MPKAYGRFYPLCKKHFFYDYFVGTVFSYNFSKGGEKLFQPYMERLTGGKNNSAGRQIQGPPVLPAAGNMRIPLRRLYKTITAIDASGVDTEDLHRIKNQPQKTQSKSPGTARKIVRSLIYIEFLYAPA